MRSQWRGGRLFVLLFPLLLSFSSRPTPAAVGPGDAAEPVVQVTHHEDESGWSVAETPNFRLFHQHSRQLAEAVLRKAEQTRAEQQRKWFGEVGEDWQPKCRIILYPSGESYGQATGAPLNPGGGHTEIQQDQGRVVSRCIHLHGPRAMLVSGVLPHEVTHAVLAGHFGGQSVPRWADEGMAILAETKARINLHLRYLPRWRDDDLLFPMRDLVQMREYPEPRVIGAFYAQSVSLVEFLSSQKGAKRFADFVRDGEREGYAASLRRHYGWSFAELDRRWHRYAFPQPRMVETTTTSEPRSSD
jgi:hypothetical protein